MRRKQGFPLTHACSRSVKLAKRRASSIHSRFGPRNLGLAVHDIVVPPRRQLDRICACCLSRSWSGSLVEDHGDSGYAVGRAEMLFKHWLAAWCHLALFGRHRTIPGPRLVQSCREPIKLRRCQAKPSPRMSGTDTNNNKKCTILKKKVQLNSELGPDLDCIFHFFSTTSNL